jgi:hypothetical protein
VSSGTLRVALTDKSDGYVFADAIRISSVDDAAANFLGDLQVDRSLYRPDPRTDLLLSGEQPQTALLRQDPFTDFSDNAPLLLGATQQSVDAAIAAQWAMVHAVGASRQFDERDEAFQNWPRRPHLRNATHGR